MHNRDSNSQEIPRRMPMERVAVIAAVRRLGMIFRQKGTRLHLVLAGPPA